jgi:hypothetical protein
LYHRVDFPGTAFLKGGAMKTEIKQLVRRAMPKTRGVKIAAVAAGVLIVLFTAAGVAVASIPSSSGVIHGCYKTNASGNGTHPLSVINTAHVSHCPSGYTSLNWNVNGSNGYGTQSSDIHLNDTLTPVASLTLPAGSYVIDADAWLEDTSPSDSSSLDECQLVFGSALDEVEGGLLGPGSTPLNNQTLSMTVAATVTSSASATLRCLAGGDTGNTYDETASITAVQVGNLHS